MSGALIYLFPGQSSRDTGMMARAAAASGPGAVDPLARAEAGAGRALDLSFGDNLSVQMAVFVACMTYLDRLVWDGFRPVASAGLSLGEYAHLVAIGALDVQSATALVAARGAAYDAGPSGKMVAVHPASAADVQGVIDRLRKDRGIAPGDLAISNDNSPGQCVVGGAADAVNAFVDAVEEDLFVQCTEIERKIPMHVARFRPVAPVLRRALDAAPWRVPTQDYWPNVTGKPIAGATAGQIVENLSAHVYSPVLWRQTINALEAAFPDALFVEVGPRSVVRDMITRRWIAKDRVVSLDPYADRPGIEDTLDRMRAHVG